MSDVCACQCVDGSTQRLTSHRHQPETWNRRLATLEREFTRGARVQENRYARAFVPAAGTRQQRARRTHRHRNHVVPRRGPRAASKAVAVAVAVAVAFTTPGHVRPRPPNQTNKETKAALAKRVLLRKSRRFRWGGALACGLSRRVAPPVSPGAVWVWCPGGGRPRLAGGRGAFV